MNSEISRLQLLFAIIRVLRKKSPINAADLRKEEDIIHYSRGCNDTDFAGVLSGAEADGLLTISIPASGSGLNNLFVSLYINSC